MLKNIARTPYLSAVLFVVGTICLSASPLSAQNDVLHVVDDKVGIGTAAPEAPLHLVSSDGTAKLIIEETMLNNQRTMFELRNNGFSTFRLADTNLEVAWHFQNRLGDFRITKEGTGQQEMVVDGLGNLTILGKITTIGFCSGGCDAVFDPDFALESIEEHASSMWRDSHLPALKPANEETPFNLTEMTGGILNELEKAHIYIEQLHQELAAQSSEMASVNERLRRLETLLEAAK